MRVRIRGTLPDGHPLNDVLSGQKGAQALATVIQLALETLRSREEARGARDSGGDGGVDEGRGAVRQRVEATGASIPKALVNFRMRRSSD